LGKLKREHAIETGVIERLYDLKKGITETFIKKGFVESYLSHGDTNVPTQQLMNHLKDHLEAVDFVFDVVKDNRFLSVGFIKELHHLVTRHQDHAEGRDSVGNKMKIPLLKGEYKQNENNPTNSEGVIIRYCPPEHVAAEMDKLIEIHDALLAQKEHPIIISAWIHHAFTTIHPFQDGNGRVGRLLASLILIKANLFPFTVLREEAREKYIDALEAADKGDPQNLVDYFATIQRRNIEKALNLKDVSSVSLTEVTDILSHKIQNFSRQQQKERELVIATNRALIFGYCRTFLLDFKAKFTLKINGQTKTSITTGSFDNISQQHYYYKQIVEYAKLHDYYFNSRLPKAWLRFRIELSSDRIYQLVTTIHHFGYDDSTIYIGAFLELINNGTQKELTTFPLDIKPHSLSIGQDVEKRQKNIEAHLEDVLTVFLAQIASEL
jgi:Fic family protein